MGGFTSVCGAEAFLNMRKAVHNFVNPHQWLKGKTPAEMAQIHLGQSKFIDLIKMRAQKSHHSLRGVVSEIHNTFKELLTMLLKRLGIKNNSRGRAG